MILDPKSTSDTVLGYVGDLLSRLDGLQKKAFDYKTHQKNFKVEVTRFDDLEEVHAEVKLKQSLWESKRDWITDNETWLTVSVHVYCTVVNYSCINVHAVL